MTSLIELDLTPLAPDFYDRSAGDVAPDLLGRLVVHDLGGRCLVARIVETEAYLGWEDAASHARGGLRSERNASLYLRPGHAYVYFVYGLHHCLNTVTGGTERGGAVLLRAVEPLVGTNLMRERRGWTDRPVRPGDLGGGPAKLAQAFGVDRALDGADLARPPLWIGTGRPVDPDRVTASPRIGIDYAGEAATWPLRFTEAGNPHVSKPRPPAG